MRSGAPQEAAIELLDASGRRAETVPVGSDLLLRAVVSLGRPTESLGSAIRVRKLDTGEVASFATSSECGQLDCRSGSQDTLEIAWRFVANLAGGHYSVELVLFESSLEQTLLRLNPAAHFGVIDERTTEGTAYVAAACSTSVQRTSRTSHRG
jgi:hypothetical protein